MIETIQQYLVENIWEVIGTVTGIVSIYLNTRENPLGWPIGLISVIYYIYIFWEVDLYGDVILHIVYLIMGVYGWYQWMYGTRNTAGEKVTLQIKQTSSRRLAGLFGVGLLTTGIMGFFLKEYTPNTLPYADAFTTAFSLVGTYMLARKYIENWLLWMVVNIACIIIYYIKGLDITSGLYVIYLILAFVGYFNWRKSLIATSNGHNHE